MDLSGKFSSASAKGGLFLPLRFQPDECRDEESGLLPSPLVIACANPDASHFCAMVTLSDAGSRMEEDDDAIQAEWTVPEGAVGGQQISDTIEVNGRQIMFVGTIPETAVPGDVVEVSNLRLEVHHVENDRIARVLLTLVDPEAGGDA